MHVLAAVGFLVLALTAAGTEPAGLTVVYLAAVTPALWAIDVREHRLPDRLVLPGYLVATLSIALVTLVTGVLPVGALVSGGAYLALTLVLSVAGGMGLGDVKLSGVLGLAAGSLSPTAALVSPVAAFVAGGVAAVVVLARSGPGTRIAFGPFLLAGFWFAVVVSPGASST